MRGSRGGNGNHGCKGQVTCADPEGEMVTMDVRDKSHARIQWEKWGLDPPPPPSGKLQVL